jgi:hypothetical protein
MLAARRAATLGNDGARAKVGQPARASTTALSNIAAWSGGEQARRRRSPRPRPAAPASKDQSSPARQTVQRKYRQGKAGRRIALCCRMLPTRRPAIVSTRASLWADAPRPRRNQPPSSGQGAGEGATPSRQHRPFVWRPPRWLRRAPDIRHQQVRAWPLCYLLPQACASRTGSGASDGPPALCREAAADPTSMIGLLSYKGRRRSFSI